VIPSATVSELSLRNLLQDLNLLTLVIQLLVVSFLSVEMPMRLLPVPVFPTILEFLPIVDQNAQSMPNVQVTELVSERDVSTRALDHADLMLYAKSRTINQFAHAQQDSVEIHSGTVEELSFPQLQELQNLWILVSPRLVEPMLSADQDKEPEPVPVSRDTLETPTWPADLSVS